MDYSKLGKRIRDERTKLHFTQEKLAEEVSLSPAYIGQIERGERSVTLDKLAAIAVRLGVTIDYLLNDSVLLREDASYRVFAQLMEGRSENERALAVNMIKLMFAYLDKESEK